MSNIRIEQNYQPLPMPNIRNGNSNDVIIPEFYLREPERIQAELERFDRNPNNFWPTVLPGRDGVGSPRFSAKLTGDTTLRERLTKTGLPTDKYSPFRLDQTDREFVEICDRVFAELGLNQLITPQMIEDAIWDRPNARATLLPLTRPLFAALVARKYNYFDLCG